MWARQLRFEKVNAHQPARVGLGLRGAFAEALVFGDQASPAFVEIAPENYLAVGGPRARLLDAARSTV